MRLATVLLCLTGLLAGCLDGAPTASKGATVPPCPTAASPATPTGPAKVEIQVANTMDRKACVQVFLDGTRVATRELDGEEPALHNNPVVLSRLDWQVREVTLKVVDVTSDRSREERVTLTSAHTNYLVAWVDEAGITVRTYEQQPQWA